MCWMKEKGWVLIPTSIFSCASFACLCVAVVTDHWLYASERLNSTNLFRNTTAGLWRKCVHDVSTTQVEWCERIDYFKHVERDGLAPTESVLLSLRKFAWFPLLSLLILLVGECCCVISQCNPQKNTLTLVAGIMFVIGGLFVLIGIVVFIGAVTEEASNSNKSRPSADDQMKVFHYRYGPSFILTIFSFISSESTGVLSVYLYISLYQLAYRKDRDHLEIPVDVNSEALAQVAGDQQLELENYRSLNTHLKNPLLSGHVYPDEEDDFSAEGVSPLVDSIGSDAALLDERGNRAGVGNSIYSPTSTQRDFKSIQFLKRQGWKFKSNATSTAFPSDLEARKVPGTDTSQGYPEHFEHSQQFHYCQQQPKSSHQSKSVGNTANASALTARSAASGLVPATLKHPTTDNLQSIFHQSQQYTSQPLQPIQRRFQLLRQDSLHKQKPTKFPTKQSQQKAQPRAQQQLYNRHDWLTNSPSPTTLYKDTATQYSPLLSQAYNHNSFKTFDSASFRGKGVDKMSPEHRRLEEIHLRDFKTREEGAKLVEKRDLNANQLDKCQQRWNSNNRPCCCQFQPHHQRRQQQNPGLYRLVSSSSKQLDIGRSGRKNAAQPEEISLVEAGLMARSAHYLPQCGLAEDWTESSVDRARSMHELRYFSYCNPQHLKSLVKPLLDDDSNFYFGRTTPV